MSEGVHLLVVLFAASLCSPVSEQRGAKARITTPILFAWITRTRTSNYIMKIITA